VSRPPRRQSRPVVPARVGPKAAEDEDGKAGSDATGLTLRAMLPNAITAAALCAGLTGIRFAIEGEWAYAVLAVILAVLPDVEDLRRVGRGHRVARTGLVRGGHAIERSRGGTRTGPERGEVATMTAILGRMATYSGKTIEWDEALNSEVSLMPERFAFDAIPPVLPEPDGAYPVPMPGKDEMV